MPLGTFSLAGQRNVPTYVIGHLNVVRRTLIEVEYKVFPTDVAAKPVFGVEPSADEIIPMCVDYLNVADLRGFWITNV